MNGANIFSIPLNPELSPDEFVVQYEFARWIISDVDHAIYAYNKLPVTEGGRILDPDLARELSRDYSQSKESRARWAVAVHEPASALIKEMYRRRLRDPDIPGKSILFSAGGPGAGKTYAIRRLKDAVWRDAHTIYDSTLSDFESAQAKFDEAFAAGKRPDVIYVHRPIDKAIRGVIDRALGRGRIVPVDVVARSHYNAQRTIFGIAAVFEDFIEVTVIDNSGTRDASHVIGVQELRAQQYGSLDTVVEQARKALEDERDRRIAEGNPIPPWIYAAISGG